MEKSAYVFFNGNWLAATAAAIPVNDLALLRGYGVFDFFLVKQGRPLFLQAHWNRLEHSAYRLHLKLPFTCAVLEQMIAQLYKHYAFELAGVRVTLTGGSSPDGYSPGPAPNYLVTMQALDAFLPHLRETGIALATFNYRRQVADVKSIDYLTGIMQWPLVKAQGFDDLLYVENETISECPRSNVFAVTDEDVLITPDEGILQGVTRKRILMHAAAIMPVAMRRVTLQDLYCAKEVWISSTTKGIWPVTRINGTLIGSGMPGPYAKQLYTMLLREMESL